MREFCFYEAFTGAGYIEIIATKEGEVIEVICPDQVIDLFEQGYKFYQVEEAPKDRFLTNADVVKAIKDHMEFLYEEYGIVSENGVILSSGDITPVKIFATFAEKFECGLYFDNDKPVIIFEKTGHRVPIKEVESIYPSRIEVSSQEAQKVLMAMYKNTFSSLSEIAEIMNMDEDKVKQVYYDMKKAMRELI